MGFFSDTMDEIAKLQAQLTQERERAEAYRHEITWALRYLYSLGMTYYKNESDPEYQIKVSFERALEKFENIGVEKYEDGK